MGRELFAAVSEIAESEGIEDLALDSWSFNASAHSFFRALGFSTYNVEMSMRRPGSSIDGTIATRADDHRDEGLNQ